MSSRPLGKLGVLTRDLVSKSDAPAVGGLLILTGASHTGKTSVAQAILDLKDPPTALLGVDQTLSQTLARPKGDRWKDIPLAYRLLRLQAEVLLAEGWFVILESTFTYVPETGEPEFHDEEIERFIGIALAVETPFLVAQLQASQATVFERAQKTRRLPLAIVAETLSLHEAAEMPDQTLRVKTEDGEVEHLARSLLASFSA